MRRERTPAKTSALVRAAAVAALALPLTLAAACTDNVTTAGSTPPPVRIGAIYNLSGSQSSLDAPALDGARLAVERINSKGGLLGRRVELLERDGQATKAGVERAARSLVASGVSAIVGLSDSEQVLGAATVAANAGVPFVTSGATSPRLTEKVPDWLFLACYGDNAQAAASAQYAAERLGAGTAAVLYDREPGSARLLARYFERSFRAQGGRVLVTADYAEVSEAAGRLAAGQKEPKKAASDQPAEDGADEGSASDGAGAGDGSGKDGSSDDGAGSPSPSASPRDTGKGDKSSEPEGAGSSPAPEPSDGVTGLGKAAAADVIFVAAGGDDPARLVRALRRAGFHQPIMGGDGFDSESLIAAAEKYGGKVYFTTHAAVGMSSAGNAVQRFDAAFAAAYGRPPENAYACLGYDAVGLIAAAVKRADSAEPGDIRTAIQKTRRYRGVSGTLGYEGDDGVPHKRVTVICVGRRPVVVAQFTPGFVASP